VELGEKQYRYEKDAVLPALSGGNQLLREEAAVRAGYNTYTYDDYLKIPDEPGAR
jgi:hypothetical protein